MNFDKKVYSFYRSDHITNKITYKSRIDNVLVSDTFEDANYVAYKEGNSLSPDHCPIELSLKINTAGNTTPAVKTQDVNYLEKLNVTGHHNNSDISLFCSRLNKIKDTNFRKKEGKKVDINLVENIKKEIYKAGSSTFGIKNVKINNNMGIYENKEWK